MRQLNHNGEAQAPKVLLVEDHKDVAFVVSETLQYHLGCEVMAARDGLECLQIVRAAMPDVILLDIHMPGMDGFEVCRILKEDEATAHIPIIFLTASCHELKNKIRGLEIGADDYLIQPIDNLELITRVKVMLRIKKLIDKARMGGEKPENNQEARAELLAMASHELRTPLNSILGFSELLTNEFYGTLNPKQKEFVNLIQANGEKLLTHIDDFIERYRGLYAD
ncbi:MAG: response regulator [Thermodesulfobacteriota bacterium]|jgi:DNA-binding response OmpR family regulator